MTQVTINDAMQCQQCKSEASDLARRARNHDSMCWRQFEIVLGANIAVFIFPHWLIPNGEVTWPTWPHVIFRENPRYMYKLWDLWMILHPVSFISLWKFLWHWRRCEVATSEDCAEVHLWRHRSVTWPDLKMRLVSQDAAWIKGQVCQVSALYRLRVRSYREKPYREAAPAPPPSDG